MFWKKMSKLPDDNVPEVSSGASLSAPGAPSSVPATAPSGRSFASGMLRLNTMDKNTPELKSLHLQTAPDGSVSAQEVLRAAEIEETTQDQLKRNRKRSIITMCVIISLMFIGVAIGSAFLANFLSAAMGVKNGNLVKNGKDTLILTSPVGIRTPVSELPSLHSYDRTWLSTILAVRFTTVDDTLHYFRVFQYDIMGDAIEMQSSFGKSLVVSTDKVYMIDETGAQTAVVNASTEIVAGQFYPYENFCSKKPCNANAACTNTPSTYTCACLSGFTGDGITCTAVDPCLAQPCAKDAKCTAKGTGFSCDCNSGYKGDGKTCEDIDECKDPKLNNCNPVNATCTNTAGSYSCTCVAGLTGNGVQCSPATPPPPAAA